MATTETYTLNDFIADLDRITREEASAHRVTERTAPLLARLVRNPGSIPAEFLKSPAGQRGRFILHRAPKFNITSVVWRPGDRATAHNHETWGVIGVIENEIEETRYRVTETRPGRAQLETLSVTRHKAGAVSRLVPGDEVHGMYNRPSATRSRSTSTARTSRDSSAGAGRRTGQRSRSSATSI